VKDRVQAVLAIGRKAWQILTAMNETSHEADRVRLQILRAMSPSKRLSLALGWSKSVRELSREGLRRQFPNGTDADVNRLLADRLLGADLALKVYGPAKAYG